MKSASRLEFWAKLAGGLVGVVVAFALFWVFIVGSFADPATHLAAQAKELLRRTAWFIPAFALAYGFQIRHAELWGDFRHVLNSFVGGLFLGGLILLSLALTPVGGFVLMTFLSGFFGVGVVVGILLDSLVGAFVWPRTGEAAEWQKQRAARATAWQSQKQSRTDPP